MKIIKLAEKEEIAVAEFEDMRESWESIFDAFDKRLDILQEIWRQQRLDIETQVQCYYGGLFEDWYQRVCLCPS